VAVLNDLRLTGDVVRAFGVLLDCSRDGCSRISFARLGERLALSRSTSRRMIRELTGADHVRKLDFAPRYVPELRSANPYQRWYRYHE
jgi:DNA-binding Lrp family transcriptional regulator